MQSPQNIKIFGSWILRKDFENEEGGIGLAIFFSIVNKDKKSLTCFNFFIFSASKPAFPNSNINSISKIMVIFKVFFPNRHHKMSKFQKTIIVSSAYLIWPVRHFKLISFIQFQCFLFLNYVICHHCHLT